MRTQCREYELANHLGNVLATVSDAKLPAARVLSFTDYYAFGGAMPGRSGGSYRYGFNGKENDSETGWQDYGMRMYNPKLARFFTVDPLTAKYPMLTPFQFASNSPVQAIDLDGLEGVNAVQFEADASAIFTAFGIKTSIAVGFAIDEQKNMAVYGSKSINVLRGLSELAKGWKRGNGLDIVNKTNSFVVASDISASMGGRVEFLPGYDNVTSLDGDAYTYGMSFSARGLNFSFGLEEKSSLADETMDEFKKNFAGVSFGVGRGASGPSLLPFTFSIAKSSTTLYAFTPKELGQIVGTVVEAKASPLNALTQGVFELVKDATSGNYKLMYNLYMPYTLRPTAAEIEPVASYDTGVRLMPLKGSTTGSMETTGVNQTKYDSSKQDQQATPQDQRKP